MTHSDVSSIDPSLSEFMKCGFVCGLYEVGDFCLN